MGKKCFIGLSPDDASHDDDDQSKDLGGCEEVLGPML
jgi:hypothetical protein